MSTEADSTVAIVTYAVCGVGLIGDLAAIYFILHIWSYRQHKFIGSRSPALTYSVLWIFFSLLLLSIANALIHLLLDFYNLNYFIIVNDIIQYGCTFAYATRYITFINTIQTQILRQKHNPNSNAPQILNNITCTAFFTYIQPFEL